MSELFIEPVVPELTLEQIIARGGTSSTTTTQSVVGGSQTPSTGTSESYKQEIKFIENISFDNRTLHNPTIVSGVIRDSEILIKENDGTNIFSLVKTGSGVGDVIIGNYTGGAGALWDKSAGTLNVKGIITATSGTIGGWTIGSTTLSATGISIDSGNKKITLGATAELVLDGTNKRIRSSNYAAGDSGFNLDSDLLEVGNIACRGLIRTAVFQRAVISAIGGSFVVLDADVLDEDTTALD